MKSPEFCIPEEVKRQIVAEVTRSAALGEVIKPSGKPLVNMVVASDSDWATLLKAMPIKLRFEWYEPRIEGLVGRPLALETDSVRIQVYPPQSGSTEGGR